MDKIENEKDIETLIIDLYMKFCKGDLLEEDKKN